MPDIMQGTSGHSFYRLHRGYHYPRSKETALECMQAESSFRSEFGPAVVDGGQQFYAVIEQGGKVNGPDYAHFIRELGLEYMREIDHPLIAADWIFGVSEPRIDVDVLTGLLRIKLAQSKVVLHLGEQMPDDVRDQFGAIVVATYARMNETLAALGIETQPYKFQYIERPIVRMPDEFKNTSIVVIDGPFGCIDPLGDTGLHILGHVTQAVHHANVGDTFQMPAGSEGAVAPESRFPQIVRALARYVPAVAGAQHVTSSFTVRAVLPDVEATDARPTLVRRHDVQTISVFSGKLGTACEAARTVVQQLRNMGRKVA